MATQQLTLLERFMAYVLPEPNSGCWLWAGSIGTSGYAQFCNKSLPTNIGHRISYLFHVGAIPAGLQLDHLCRNKLCVNPQHLEPVTARENGFRAGGLPKAVIAAAQKKREITHCPQGHSYSEDNVYRYGGRRVCKTCATSKSISRQHRIRGT